MSTPIRLLLVDDDPLVRSGLRFLFDSTPDVKVIAEAGDGAEAIAAVRAHAPDVVLMDLLMPGVDGIAATAEIKRSPASAHVIALTTWDVNDAVIRSLEAGASGFMLKTAPPPDIIAAVRAVHSGDAVLSPRSTRQLLDHLRRDETVHHRRAAEQALGSLTDREREVCIAAALGLSNAEIAGRLFISDATVKSHLSAIQVKLGLRNRVEVAVLTERAGLLRQG